MPFSQLGLSEPIVEATRKMGFTEPTPIQAAAIPLILEGRDVIGSAQTGTGKTAAFALPILTKLVNGRGVSRALILEPTRELAAQVDEALKNFGQFLNLRVAVVYGGVGYGKQLEDLKKGADIIVATPGRLLDHLQRGTARLDTIEYLVLDEADRMLDMGFLPDVRRIVQKCPRKRHTSLFSATIPPEIDSLIKWAMQDPQTVEIGARRSPAELVKHVLYPVAQDQKTDLLRAVLEQVHYESVIVFCRTRHGADKVSRLLHKNRHSVAVIHSSRTQREREQALRGFRDGKYEVLVARDIASRGLDIEDVSHVINFDVPQHPEDYVHRIGRTGRAKASGDAFTLMTAEDVPHIEAIERFIGQKIERVKLPNFNYQYSTVLDERFTSQSHKDRRVKGVRLSGGYYFGPAKRRR